MNNKRPLLERRTFIDFIRWKRLTGWRLWCLLGLFMGGTTGLSLFVGLSTPDSREWFWGIVAMVVFFAVFIAIAMRWGASPVPRCPVCGASTEGGSRFIMIATGRCGNCGNAVFSDMKTQDAEEREPHAPFADRLEFLHKQREQRWNWRNMAALILAFLWIAGFVGLSRLVKALPELAISPVEMAGAAFAALAYLIFSGPLVGTLLDRLVPLTMFRCPACRESLLGRKRGIVITSGRCGGCGEAIFQCGSVRLGSTMAGALDRHEFVARVPWLHEKNDGSSRNLWRWTTGGFVLVVGLLTSCGNAVRWIMVALLVGFAASGLQAVRQRRHLAKCPCCTKSTQHPLNRPVIVATGRCGRCGEAILTAER